MSGDNAIMTDLYKYVCILGILWAVWVPPYLWYRDVRDQQYRQLRAVAALMPGVSPEKHGTNDMGDVWQMYARDVSRLAQAEHSRKSTFDSISWISSGFILVLSVCALNAGQRKRNLNTEPSVSPNDVSTTRTGDSGPTEEPPLAS